MEFTCEITHKRLLWHVQYFAGVSPFTMNIDFERAAMNACETTISSVKCPMLFFSFMSKCFLKSERKYPPLENGRQVG